MKKLVRVGCVMGGDVMWEEGYEPSVGDHLLWLCDGVTTLAGTVYPTYYQPGGFTVVWTRSAPPAGTSLYVEVELHTTPEKVNAEAAGSGDASSDDCRPDYPANASCTLAALEELARAEKKFPLWPHDPLHALAVLGEEFGELTQAMLELTYEPGKDRATLDHVRTEAVQTAAMALRLLKNMDNYDFTKKP